MSPPISASIMKVLIASLAIVCLLGIVLVAKKAEALNLAEQIEQQQASIGKSSATLAVIENPELVARVLDSLLRSVMYSTGVDIQPNQSMIKRGLDLGISRGFSGSQAGKHLMGLSAASFANGPGRR